MCQVNFELISGDQPSLFVFFFLLDCVKKGEDVHGVFIPFFPIGVKGNPCLVWIALLGVSGYPADIGKEFRLTVHARNIQLDDNGFAGCEAFIA